MGSNDAALKKEGIADAEIQKIKKFHQCMQEGKYFFSTATALGIESHIAKKMLVLYEENKAGLPLSYGLKRDRETHPRIISAFSMLLDGATDSEMLTRGCLELEIENAKTFLRYVGEDMLIVTLAERTHTMRATATKLKKIYNKKKSSVNEQVNTNAIVHRETITALRSH